MALGSHVPLLLDVDDWERLRVSGGRIETIWLPCRDHESGVQIEYEISIRRGRIDVVGRQYACEPDGRRGKLIEKLRF